MNVAILSASRKVWLIRAFQAALAKIGGGRVYALDTDNNAVALRVADVGCICPPSDSNQFPDWLLSWCRANAIKLLVPTRDAELPVIAQLMSQLLHCGTQVAISHPSSIVVCQDKRLFANRCKGLGFNTPLEFESIDNAKFPVFIKPRSSTAAKFGLRFDSASDLRKRGYSQETEMLQEFLAFPEFTIDVFIDWNGRLVSSIPRRRIRVIADESVVTATVRDENLMTEAGRLALQLKLVGHITVQAFRTDDRIIFFEINPRFGGGAALGFKAGSPTPEWMIKLALGETLESQLGKFEANLWMFRHTSDIFAHENCAVKCLPENTC